VFQLLHGAGSLAGGSSPVSGSGILARKLESGIALVGIEDDVVVAADSEFGSGRPLVRRQRSIFCPLTKGGRGRRCFDLGHRKSMPFPHQHGMIHADHPRVGGHQVFFRFASDGERGLQKRQLAALSPPVT